MFGHVQWCASWCSRKHLRGCRTVCILKGWADYLLNKAKRRDGKNLSCLGWDAELVISRTVPSPDILGYVIISIHFLSSICCFLKNGCLSAVSLQCTWAWFSWYLVYLGFIGGWICCGLWWTYFTNFSKFLDIIFSNILFSPFSFFSFSVTPIIHILLCLLSSHRFQMLCPLFFCFCFSLDFFRLLVFNSLILFCV